jgi:protein-S-isoprenylcysteine O-methyltransferase Ste14
MAGEMSRWGIGPQFTLISIVYAMVIFLIHLFWIPSFTFTIISRKLNLILGIILIIVGLLIFLIPALTIDKYFYEGRICTTGIYSFIRHPIYGSWIIFIIPGIVLISGSLLAISIPIFMYAIFKSLIPKEEKYLEKKFGEEYIEYKKKVNAVFPTIWRQYTNAHEIRQACNLAKLKH